MDAYANKIASKNKIYINFSFFLNLENCDCDQYLFIISYIKDLFGIIRIFRFC